MRPTFTLGLVVIGILLFLRVGQAQTTAPELFEAMRLIALPKAVALPAVSLPDIHGKNIAFKSLRGKVVLLNFWTTW